MAKYSLPEMFGQLPDIVMQGFSDPEDIMNIAETGQPAKMEEAILPIGEGTGLPDSGDIYGDVLNMTDDPMLANMAASGAASDELVQAMITDLSPSPETLRIEQAADAVINSPNTQTPLNELVTIHSRTYGVPKASLKNAVIRKQRQQEIDEKQWWHGKDDGIPMFDPSSYTVDPNAAIEEVLGDSIIDGKNISNEWGSPIAINQNPNASVPTADGSPIDAVKGFLAKTVDNITDVVGGAINTRVDNEVARTGSYPIEEQEINIASPSTTDALIQSITESEKTSPDVSVAATTPSTVPSTTTATSPQPSGTSIDFGTEKFNDILRNIRSNTFGSHVASDKLADGSEMFTYINPNTQSVYNITGLTDPDLTNIKIWDVGKLELSEDKEGISRYKIGDQEWDYHKSTGMFMRPQTSYSGGSTSVALPTTGGLYGRTPEDQWDILRAREMGDDAFNPVLWNARRYGLRPAFGEYLLSGGLVDGTQQPFYEWLPTRGERDRSQDWDALVKASNLMSTGSLGWADQDLRTKNLGTLMQGDAAKTNILNMTATALGAGEGYTSNQMRSYLSNLYDVYESQMAGQAKPVGGFAAWIDQRRAPDPSTLGTGQSTSEG